MPPSTSTHLLRLRGFYVILIIAFVVAGMFGRDPWKADEPYSVGIVLDFATGHDWIVPRVAGDPFVEKPPLMYWTGALAARATQGWLPLFDSAQLAVLAWIALMLWLLARTTRQVVGKGRSLLACMLLLGTLGMVSNIHKLTADIPFTAGAVMALAALVQFADGATRSRGPGLLLGTGAGIAFMSKGLLVPGVLGITCIAAFVLPAFRSRKYLAGLGWAGLAALPWLVIWPYLFWQASEPRFIEWIWDNNFGRFFGFVHLGGARTGHLDDLRSLLGLTFPTGWLAVGAAIAVIRRDGWRQYMRNPVTGILWLYTFIFIGTLSASSSVRDIYMMPMFPALALLAAGVILPRWFDRVWTAAAVVLFSVLGAWVWLRWGLMLSGHGEVGALGLGRVLPLDYPLQFNTVLFAGAVALTLLWGIAVWRCRTLGALVTGFAGLTFVWGAVHTLLLPWIDEARSYRTAFTALRHALPAHYDCVAVYNVGESERAMLDYLAGIKPMQLPSLDRPVSCTVLLILDKAHDPIKAPADGWTQIWQGGRMGDTNERFRAFVRH